MNAEACWTRHWQADVIDACVPDNGQVRSGLDRCWQQFFGRLPDAARLLDLGTGNGALALRALVAAERCGRTIEIHGVDAARIDPARYVAGEQRARLAQVHFHAGVSIESLPFEADRFDCVVSQYAFEYADIERAASEVARVLRPGAPAKFLVHSADAPVVGEVREALHAMRKIAASALFASAESLLQRLVAARRAGQGATPDIQRQIAAFRSELDVQRAALCSQQRQGLAGDLLTAVAALPAQALADPERAPEDWTSELHQRLAAQIERYEDMIHACRDSAGLKSLMDILVENGLEHVEMHRAVIDPPGVCTGHWISARGGLQDVHAGA